MTLVSILFLVTAILYSSVGFGGGSTYLALLLITGIPYFIIPVIALSCNIIVVLGNCINYIRAGNLNFKNLAPYLIGSIPLAFIGGSLPIEKKVFEIILFLVLAVAGILLLFNFKSYDDKEMRKKLKTPKYANRKTAGDEKRKREAAQRKKLGLEEVEIDEAFFKVKIPDVAPTFVEASSAGAVKASMRKVLKPDVVADLEIERVTPAAMKKMYRDMAQGKDEVDESVVEMKSSSGYELYHKDFSGAMQHAYKFAKSKGYTVDPKEIDNKVATGPKRPSRGKTNKYILGTNKKQNVHIQVYNMDNKRYELNMYIS